MNTDSRIISGLLKTAKLVRNCLPKPLRLAQSPDHPIADDVDVDWRPRPPRPDDGGHTHCTCHELGDANDLDRTMVAQGHVRAHLLVSFGRWTIRERGCEDGPSETASRRPRFMPWPPAGGWM